MLPAASRLTKSQEFRLVIRRGRRAGRSRLVVHALRPGTPETGRVREGAEHRALSKAHSTPTRDSTGSTRVGFVVSKAVG
ncbi:ribonuclease P protein component, partial [Klebsiella pneumoniae]|nr:ribonuclease P protein component [Klebsiella pneumoniae]